MAEQTNEVRKRVTYFDWLRGAATMAVVLLHVFNFILTDHPVSELGWPLVLVWTELQLALTRWAVPIFFMITGALLLDPRRTVTYKKVGRYVVRMLAVLAIFGPVYACMSARAITPAAIVEGWNKVLHMDSWDHLWYVYAIIILYLLTPVLSLFVARTPLRTQQITLVVLAILTLAGTTLGVVLKWHMPFVVGNSSALFYFLLGTYVHQHVGFDRRLVQVGVLALAICMGWVALEVLVGGTYPKWLLRPGDPLVAAYALALFLLAREKLEGTPAPAWLAFMSSHSLSIYLFHPLVLIIFYRRIWWMPYEQLPPVAFELVVYGAVLGGACALAALASRIPGLKRILG